MTFKVGDKVRRKPGRTDGVWPHKDRAVSVESVKVSRGYQYLNFADTDPTLTWAAENFEPAETV